MCEVGGCLVMGPFKTGYGGASGRTGIAMRLSRAKAGKLHVRYRIDAINDLQGAQTPPMVYLSVLRAEVALVHAAPQQEALSTPAFVPATDGDPSFPWTTGWQTWTLDITGPSSAEVGFGLYSGGDVGSYGGGPALPPVTLRVRIDSITAE